MEEVIAVLRAAKYQPLRPQKQSAHGIYKSALWHFEAIISTAFNLGCHASDLQFYQEAALCELASRGMGLVVVTCGHRYGVFCHTQLLSVVTDDGRRVPHISPNAPRYIGIFEPLKDWDSFVIYPYFPHLFSLWVAF